MASKIFDTIIIGSGPAGLTAAIYASRGDLKTLVIGGVEAGGQLMLTTEVEDFPGFPNSVQGPKLMFEMRKQAENLGAEIINEDVIKVDFTKQPLKVFVGEKDFLGKTVIVATGASARWLGLENEKRLIGKGVSACAVCDGPFFKGKVVAVVGGGDSAIKEALFLAKLAREVTVIHRRDALRAFQSLQDRALATSNIKFVWNSMVEEVLGDQKVEGVRIKNLKTGEVSTLPIDGLFIAIGHQPNTEFLKKQLELDEKNYIVLKDRSKTSVPGVFAAGDVADWQYQQAVTAAAAGCIAAIDAQDWLEEAKTKKKNQGQ